MTRRQITAQEVRKLSRIEGVHRAAPGLYLRVRGGSALWTFRIMVKGRASEYSLGSVANLTLADAVAKSADLRARAKRGEPLSDELKRPQKNAVHKCAEDTFEAVARQLWEAMKPGWKNPKHAEQWINTLSTYAFPIFGAKPVAQIETEDVLAALRPIWSDKHETATRLRQRIEAVLSAAKARGLRQRENPALWRGHLDKLLPAISKRKRVEHHPAMPWQEVPAFMAELRARPSMSSRALQFTILTAARTGEVIGMRWPEIDLRERLWIIPAARMKAHREHRVPLSSQALALLRDLPRMEGSDAVFWGFRRPTISNMAMLELLRGMRPGLTVHGFRSSFRDWVSEATSFPSDVAEMALAHTIPNQVEAAYRRGDLIEKRRSLMQAWGSFLDNAPDCETGGA